VVLTAEELPVAVAIVEDIEDGSACEYVLATEHRGVLCFLERPPAVELVRMRGHDSLWSARPVIPLSKRPPELVLLETWLRYRAIGRQPRDIETLFDVFVIHDLRAPSSDNEYMFDLAISHDRNRIGIYPDAFELCLLLGRTIA
jgi:hypothetical protein